MIRGWGRNPSLVALAAGLCLAGGAARAGGPEPAMAVKAAYLVKLAPFVEWPVAAFPASNSPLYVCVAGDDPFGPILDDALQGQKLGDHPMAVRRLGRIEHGETCQILYVAGSKGQAPAEALRAVDGAPMLTVTDKDRGGGGVVQFVNLNGRIRFEIDLAAAARNGLAISSKLLGLALNVRPKD